jgi:hypothetical protein
MSVNRIKPARNRRRRFMSRTDDENRLEMIGRQFGLDTAQTRAAFEQLAPVIAAGLRRNTQSNDGLGALIEALGSGGHGRYVDDPEPAELDAATKDGNAILGHVFGSKDVSRGVASQAADLSGVGSAILKKMLPVIAAMVMGALAKRMTGGARRAPSQAGRGGSLGGVLGDILGGGAGPQQRAPRPGGGSQGDGGLADILGDILGGGGRPGSAPSAPHPAPGGASLDDRLREILGGGAGGSARNEEVVKRSRDSFDDALGGGTPSGNAADDLLNSVEKAIRRRR